MLAIVIDRVSTLASDMRRHTRTLCSPASVATRLGYTANVSNSVDAIHADPTSVIVPLAHCVRLGGEGDQLARSSFVCSSWTS